MLYRLVHQPYIQAKRNTHTMERKPLRSSSKSVKINCVRSSKDHSTKFAIPKKNWSVVERRGERTGDKFFKTEPSYGSVGSLRVFHLPASY